MVNNDQVSIKNSSILTLHAVISTIMTYLQTHDLYLLSVFAWLKIKTTMFIFYGGCNIFYRPRLFKYVFFDCRINKSSYLDINNIFIKFKTTQILPTLDYFLVLHANIFNTILIYTSILPISNVKIFIVQVGKGTKQPLSTKRNSLNF